MKARHILGLAVLMAVAGSCKKNQNQDTSSFSASIEVDESRTYLEGKKVKWSVGDQIIVYGDGAPKAYTLSTGDGTQTATFTTTGGVQPASTYCAFYPAASCTGVSGDVFTFTMPDTQTYTSGGFMNNLNPMAAKNDGNGGTTLGFRNAFAILKVSATGNNCAITSIELTTTGNAYQLSGTFTFDYINKATSLSSGTGNTITLSGISTTLTSTAQPFYFVVPPQALANGFSVTYKNGNVTIDSKTVTQSQVSDNYTLAPNKILNLTMSVEATGVTNLVPNVTKDTWWTDHGNNTKENINYGAINGMKFIITSSSEIHIRPNDPVKLIKGHSYYVRFYTKVNDYGSQTNYDFFWPEDGGTQIIANSSQTKNDEWKMHSAKVTNWAANVSTVNNNTDYYPRIDINGVQLNNDTHERYVAGVMLIDLTEAGLAGLTKPQLDDKPYFYGITPTW